MRMDDDDPREESMNKYTKRRKRRRANAIVKWGTAAVRAHCKLGGRTGGVQSKRTPGKAPHHIVVRPNPPGPTGMNLG